ncbi:MAG: AMP-binding protein, partial [Waterburya sp.]
MQEQKKKPNPLGLLDFNCCPKQVDTVAKLLEFDLNSNSMGQPKLMIQGNFIAVGQIEILNEWSQSPLGTITAIEPNFLKVSSSSYEVALGQLQTLEGQALGISDLLEKFALQVGSKFEVLKPETVRQMETFDSLIAEHEAFWVERLANLQPIAIPYADSTTPPSLQKRFAKVTVPVPDEVISCLNKNQNWNPGDFLLATFVGYLARIGGTNNFDLGLRDLELVRELNQSQGFFAASVPCHLEINLEQSFAEFLTAVREQVELTKQHKTYRRDIIVRDSRLRFIPELASSEIFPVVIDRSSQIVKPESNLGSELTMVIPDDGRQWIWLYSVEAFNDESIARMVEQFTIFLRNIVQDLTKPLAQLSLLSEEEYHKILVEWNDTTVDYSKYQCIHQLFEQQVAKTPEAIALIFAEQQLTYQELNQRADVLAAYLREIGVKAEVLVGICVERSIEMVVGILAILKAGGAYVPLDPSYPIERIGYMLSDAQVAVLLTQQSLNLGELLVQFPQPQTKVINFEQIPLGSTPENHPTLATSVNPSNLAYVIYTSGSTGKPKGVQIEHRTAVNLLTAIAQEPGIDAKDTLLSVTTISFDIAVLEIFLPLIVGAKLAIVSRQTAMDGHQLIQALEQYQATLMQSTPIT